MHRTVLSVSKNSAVQVTRNLILERAGYKVLSTIDLSEAVRLFETSNVDAIILGDSLGPDERHELGTAFKTLRPAVPIIMVGRVNDSRSVQELADEHLESMGDPRLLLEALARVLNHGHSSTDPETGQ
jgi:DNA-binding NtrC family response regulator